MSFLETYLAHKSKMGKGGGVGSRHVLPMQYTQNTSFI